MHATLNSLTSLTISHSDILLHLTLPHLKNLTIEDEEDYYDEEEEDDDDENPRSKILSTILTFVQRSSCVLKSLELPRPTTLISHDAEELFRSLPQLKRLVSEIYGRDNFNNFVACFSISEKSVPLPELEELDLRPYPSPTDSAISLLLEITEARRKRGQGITKMEKLSLRNCEIPLSPALVKKAKRLQDDGAAITLRDRRDEIAFPNGGTLEQVKSVGFPLLPRFSGGGH
ncbi:hypothetical protein AX16_002798 [Volvariella volvacea WC 439]|nr:hypothetical protein AX16_002798 [Volvariella volvacea WC 439]